MQPQVPNQGQSLSMPLPANQSQPHQQLLSQNIQNNIPAAGVQSSAGLSSALPPSSGLTQTPIPSIVGQNQNMQNMGQGVPSNMFATSQRQLPGRQQVVPKHAAAAAIPEFPAVYVPSTVATSAFEAQISVGKYPTTCPTAATILLMKKPHMRGYSTYEKKRPTKRIGAHVLRNIIAARLY
ncbi:unnamed protein product [Prunus armeniaca]